MPCRLRVALLAAALAVGCVWDTVTYSDEGDLCFDQQGENVFVIVKAPDCLSSKCSRDVDGSCEVTMTGSTFQLETEIHWEQRDDQLANCSKDCGDATATCPLGRLDPGTYTILHGEDTFVVNVPVLEGCFE